VALAIAGVFVPGLPTTVFVIAASYFFTRSSPGLDRWLHANRWLGPALQRFAETGGMPARSKAAALASMWAGLTMSWLALANAAPLQMLTLAAGVSGTAVLLFFVRTTPAPPAGGAR
jgi:uncharacterized membrane protein YbaN (DUF454 family)